MSTKNTQKTEDMLDQTFANFDTQVTGMDAQTGEDSGGKSKSQNASALKGKSSNKIIFIAAGVAAVCVVAYLAVLKPMLSSPAPRPQPQQQVKAPEPTPMPTPTVAPEPIPIPTTESVPTIEPISVPIPVPTPITEPNPIQENELNVETPLEMEKIEIPENNNVAVIPENNSELIPIIQEQGKLTQNYTNNANSVSIVNDLQLMFEKQSAEFNVLLSNVDSKVGNIENQVKKQEDINSNILSRLTALESGKKIAPQVQKSEQSSNLPVVKKIVKKSNTKTSTKVKEQRPSDSDVLIDKTRSKSSSSSKIDVEDLNVYSIYAGRAWIKNEDGTVSNYTVGDELPTGEKIRKINDEQFEIITNKRTIRK